jgi:hypothetical protein
MRSPIDCTLCFLSSNSLFLSLPPSISLSFSLSPLSLYLSHTHTPTNFISFQFNDGLYVIPCSAPKTVNAALRKDEDNVEKVNRENRDLQDRFVANNARGGALEAKRLRREGLRDDIQTLTEEMDTLIVECLALTDPTEIQEKKKRNPPQICKSGQENGRSLPHVIQLVEMSRKYSQNKSIKGPKLVVKSTTVFYLSRIEP